jgi:hypothetical protein
VHGPQNRDIPARDHGPHLRPRLPRPLVYCGSGRCHHGAALNGDQFPDDLPVRSLCNHRLWLYRRGRAAGLVAHDEQAACLKPCTAACSCRRWRRSNALRMGLTVDQQFPMKGFPFVRHHRSSVVAFRDGGTAEGNCHSPATTGALKTRALRPCPNRGALPPSRQLSCLSEMLRELARQQSDRY